jgi:hypothetical protein
VVANVVVIDLGKRNVKQAENQDHDSRQPRARVSYRPLHGHTQAPIEGDTA